MNVGNFGMKLTRSVYRASIGMYVENETDQLGVRFELYILQTQDVTLCSQP